MRLKLGKYVLSLTKTKQFKPYEPNTVLTAADVNKYMTKQ